MIDSQRIRASRSDDSESLSVAITRMARTARWQMLAVCATAGAIGVPAAWLVGTHRIVLVSAAAALGAFGTGGLADRILADERAGGDPDRVLVVGFTAIRWLSIAIGTGSSITCVMWLLFAAMGASHLAWH